MESTKRLNKHIIGQNYKSNRDNTTMIKNSRGFEEWLRQQWTPHQNPNNCKHISNEHLQVGQDDQDDG